MKFILVVLCMLVSEASLAEAFKTSGAAREFTDKVMGRVATGDIEGGLKMMKPYTIVSPAEFDSMVEKTSLQLPAITQRFGKSLGQEFIAEDKIGKSLVRLVYLNRFERHAMRWTFYLYNGADGWNINTFKFDDQIHDLFPH